MDPVDRAFQEKMWNEKYDPSLGFAYGVLPNDFLRACEPKIKRNANIISLGEGEGRNALFLAQQGHSVHCLDLSEVGLKKARKLADDAGFSKEITTELTDLVAYDFGEEKYDGMSLVLVC